MTREWESPSQAKNAKPVDKVNNAKGTLAI